MQWYLMLEKVVKKEFSNLLSPLLDVFCCLKDLHLLDWYWLLHFMILYMFLCLN